LTAQLKTQAIDAAFFDWRDDTAVAWLGNAGVLIVARGTVLLIDPVISLVERDGERVLETGHRLKTALPIEAETVPRADAVLYTHADGDHFGRRTAEALDRRLKPTFVAPPPVCVRLEEMGVPKARLVTAREGESIPVDSVRVTVTPALHDWQQTNPWQRGDCCGFLVKTPDGTVWHPGDTRLLDEHLQVRGVDVLFFDVAVCRSHLGPEGSARLAATCGAADLIAYHYGTVDVPPGGPFGSDPAGCLPLVADLPSRFLLLNPGEPFRLPSAAPDRV